MKPEPIRVPIELVVDRPDKAIHAKLDVILAHLRSVDPPEPLSNNYVALQNERDHWLEAASQQHERRVKAEKRVGEQNDLISAVAAALGMDPRHIYLNDLVPAIQQLRKRAEAGDLAVMNLEEHHEVHGEERVALINRNRKLVAEVAELQRQLNEARSAAEDVVVGANTVIDHRDDGITRLQRRLEAQKAHIQQQAGTITRRNEDLRRVRKRSHNAIVALQADIGRMEEELALRDGQIASLKRSMGHLVAPGMPGPAEER